ncbi:phytoene desaturase family protein [Salegentibacter salegens]|uniref:Phytoene dehydrogenase-related protein n=1 Tax=Salegentibacter salegens TaxID=143223 RepID=A0A1M7L3S7_9FLAO|nr:NAD(P)/FAD-dependent oxidoreductase [Salegentibacter salegens]PRX44841.1 phytoene dehydrogenase-like protein [Salegentibacter salegens]SHM71965.1 Phytoene dehydrogenase-related protein [Salegentibacter salegens]
MPLSYDAIIIGSGSNGISAAIYLQQKGLKTAIFEQAATPGGSTRTQELTLPGFKHDVGSAILPMGFGSPFLRSLPLEKHGLEWIFPEIPYAHPFADGTAHACYTDLRKTADQLGNDESSYLKLFDPLVKNWGKIENDLLGPLGIPDHPLDFMKFGMKALPSAKMLAKHYFKNEKSRIFFYGSAAHSTLPLDNLASASFGLVLNTMAHKYNWPFPKGGAQNFINSMMSYYTSIGGELQLEKNITQLRELPESKTYLFDLTPKQLLKIKETDFSNLYRKRMNSFKYGAGVFKIDWALNKPIPFTNEKCRKAGTVHIGFSEEEMETSEQSIHQNNMTQAPYVLVAQHSIFDISRAPAGKHTAWAYCHVPNGSNEDFSKIIEDQIERAAPGFKNCILKKSTMNSVQLNAFNPNIIGGDINGGKQDITQLFTRPIAKISPYSTSNPKIYICSSSTPPGGGVHGMCGFNAARTVIKDHF